MAATEQVDSVEQVAGVEQTDSVVIPEAPQGRRHIPCPVEGYPGYVAVNTVMTPQDFQRWYEKNEARQARKNDKRHPHFGMYEAGNHLVEWHVERLEPAHFKSPDGSDMPAMELVSFAVWVMLDLVERATKRPFFSGL